MLPHYYGGSVLCAGHTPVQASLVHVLCLPAIPSPTPDAPYHRFCTLPLSVTGSRSLLIERSGLRLE